MMARTRFVLFVAAKLFLLCFSSAQNINEYLFPKFPLKNISAEIVPTTNGFIIQGINSSNWYIEFFDRGGAMYVPYYLKWNGKDLSLPIIVPDTLHDDYGGFDSQSDRWKISTVFDSSSNPFTMWSTVRNYMSDVPPTYLDSPKRAYAQTKQGVLQKVFVDSFGLNPSIVLDDKQIVHSVWEKANPIKGNSPYKKFQTFSSEILYKQMGLDGSQYTDLPEKIGKGFYPEIKIRNGKPYILFFAADSSTSKTFSLQFNQEVSVLHSEICYLDTFSHPFYRFTPLSVQQPFLRSLSWDVDTAEGIHAVWYDNTFEKRKIHIIHTRLGMKPFTDTTIIIIPAYGEIHTRILKNGEIYILLLTPSGTLQYFISTYGSPAVEKNSFSLNSSNSFLRSLFADKYGDEYAIVGNANDIKGMYIIKYIGTDSSKIILHSTKYSVDRSVLVDTNNIMWSTGKRDSTSVLLSINLNTIGYYPNFYFPLTVGDEWYYYFYPDASQQFPETDIHKATADTVMPNSKKYVMVTSRFLKPQYYRKEGLTVYQFRTTDSTEHLRFDFSRNIGDTINYFPRVILKDIEQSDIFIPQSLLFTFEGSVSPDGQDYQTSVADSIGIKSKASLAGNWEMIGAKINGKLYGTVLGIDDKTTSLPIEFSLSQNYPNPFNPTTTISYQLPTTNHITLKVFDVLGREVSTLVNELKNAGTYSVQWNASQFSSGMYFLQLQAGEHVQMKKMVLLK